jgi:type VI secretion system VasD/TssJ family lipoprotein
MGVKSSGFQGFSWAARAAKTVAMTVVMSASMLACSHSSPPPPAAAPAAGPAAPPPCTTPEPLRVSIAASKRLNPGEHGEALATVVRLYQLKGSGKLTGASFDELLDHDKDALGEDYLSMQEVTINPNDKVDPPMNRNADAAYIAAVALFRQPAGTTWRAIKKLPAPDPQHCHATPAAAAANATQIFLDENRLELR